MILYVVTMHRWGDDETHNYVQGVFSSEDDATLCGEAEKAWRGNKYEPKITKVILNQHDHETLDWLEECKTLSAI